LLQLPICSIQTIGLLPDARSFYNRGLSYRKLEKEEKAIKDFKKAQDLDPNQWQ
jgi:tetratricopeptide (TPR) repeat protein